MITREQVIEMARECGDKDKTDPVYIRANDTIEFGIFGEAEFIRLINAAYKRGVEDAINKTVELGAIDRDGVFADEIRALLNEYK